RLFGGSLRLFDLSLQQAVLVGRASRDGLLCSDDFNLHALSRGSGFSVCGVDQHFSGWSGLVDHRQVADYRDRVSAKPFVYGFDEINSRVAFAKHHHPRVIEVVEWREPLAPTAHQLIRIEQRNTRIVRDIERLAITFAIEF